MRTGTYYMNNSGSKWITYPKEKIYLCDPTNKYFKLRTIEYMEAFGNFAVACISYKGKKIKGFIQDCNGVMVLFVNYQDYYNN